MTSELEVAVDPAESRRSDEPVCVSEARSRLLFDANPLPMWVYDCETLRFLEVERRGNHAIRILPR